MNTRPLARTAAREWPRFVLLLTWLFSFAVLFSTVNWLQWSGRIGQESHDLMSRQLIDLFKPYLLMMAGFSAGRVVRHLRSVARFTTAMVASLLWIGWVFVYVGSLVAGHCCVESAARQMQGVAEHLSWIIGPAIGFYFGQRD